MYFLGRELKSLPLSGTEILLQSSLFLSLRPDPLGEVTPPSSLMTVRGEFLKISFWVVLLPAEARPGLLGRVLLGESGSGPREREVDRV